ncbi:MAG TPA: hypothetical protein VHO01_11595 [Jatrophihabitans sp.]|nr:hypothetical protein [Jatrophihabitans sp.]
MNTTEDRLRAAFGARAEQLSEARLNELSAQRQAAGQDGLQHEAPGLFNLDGSEHTVLLEPAELDRLSVRRHRRWVAPALAAAAVAVVAIGVAAVVGTSRRAERPAIAPSTPSMSAPAPTSTPTAGPTTPSADAPSTSSALVPAGQVGTRAQVPWSQVGAGWRLLRPVDSSGIPQGTLYLVDPLDGRYLITDQLPPQTRLAGWSADAAIAALQQMDSSGIQLIDLHSGELGAKIPGAQFAAFTRPKGTALLAFVKSQLIRFGADGQPQQTYSNKMNGIGLLLSPTLYLPDGTSFVAGTTTRPVLIGNNGAPQAVYPVPAGYNICYPVKLWNSHTLLENCQTTQPSFSLFLQDLNPGTPPTLLADGSDGQLMTAWALSNGDTLLQVYANCQQNPYLIKHADGSISPLRLPAGVSLPTEIANMNGDLATFITNKPGCGTASDRALIDYNIVTGVRQKLLATSAEIQDLPAF